MEHTNKIWDKTPLSDETAKRIYTICGLDIHPTPELVHILDFGCGGGRYLEVFARIVPKEKLIGVEVDEIEVKCVREKGFQCLQISPEKDFLPFEEKIFDIVFSSNVIEHIPRNIYFSYLNEFKRILKPGGRFVLGTPNYPIKRFYDIFKAFRTKEYRYYLLDDPTHCNKMSIFRVEKDLKSIFSKVNLNPTYILGEKIFPFLKKEKVRRCLRILGDKIIGYCVK